MAIVLAGLAVATAGCQSTPTATATATAAVPTTAPGVSPTPGPGPGELLASSLAALTAASEFDSTVTVDGAVATVLRGRTVGSASMLSVTSSGRTVEYLRIPPNAWARETGSTWLLVDSGQAPASPLAALASPRSVAATARGGATLEATYDAPVLGLEGDPVTVLVTIAGSVVTFRYEQTTSGHAVVSTTVLGPATDTTPIESPAA